ncbi:MAG: ribonuclease Z [Desulfobacterales bacterium]|jgi:ribonuclease Z
MRPSFHPRLVNDPFDDPVLFIPFPFANRAMMFDLGDITGLAARDILKTSHVFISHTHMDHFIGFDRLLRLHLGREKSLYLYGPEGFHENLEGKLAGYSWNLVENYANRFVLYATEILSKKMTTKQYFCRDKFLASGTADTETFTDIVHQEPALTVSAVLLEHGIPCLGYAIKERFHINIMKDKLADLKLETGPWLNRFKQALYQQASPEAEFVAADGNNNRPQKRFQLGDLAKRIARLTPGQKICYVVDVGYTASNIAKIIGFAKNADQLFIEAAFLEKHKEVARLKNHLTARQAGTIAGKSRVKQLKVFHFSPRYNAEGHLLEQEALDAYRSVPVQENSTGGK